MRLILVRHGDTETKVEEGVQSPENPLSETGILQAKKVGKHLAKYNINLILSSPLPRARDTTELINETLQKKIVINDLLVEVKWPTILEGKKLDDPMVKEYRKLRNENNIAGTTWHYSDEENFIDLKTRARKLLDEIKDLKVETVLAVTSSTFMKVVVMVMCHGDDVTWETYFDFLDFTRPRHTSISTFDLDEKGKWHMDAWNMLNE